MSRKLKVRLGVATLAAVAPVYAIAWATGRGTLGQFSPDSLEIRSQVEWLVPPTEIAIYRSGSRYYQNDLIRFLVDQGYWSPRDVPEPRWISLFRYNAQWRDGWSGLQHEVFLASDKWMAWTKSNRRFAALIWPQMLRVLRDERHGDPSYAVHMLRVAEEAGSVREYERRMAADIDWPKDLGYLPGE